VASRIGKPLGRVFFSGVELAKLLQNPNDPQAEALLDLLADRLAEKLAAKLGQQTKPREEGRLLSLRAAAEKLGVDRKSTLKTLIADRRIRVVTINGRPRIPMSEIERIERDGATLVSARRAKGTPRPAQRAPTLSEMLAGYDDVKV
jgi:DNA-binding LytR/AlgR family response regulator